MQQRPVTIINKLGLHARAAARFVTTASAFSSHVDVEKNGQHVNGKSIMGVMMLAAEEGVSLRISASGPDETEALEALVTLIDTKFGEEG